MAAVRTPALGYPVVRVRIGRHGIDHGGRTYWAGWLRQFRGLSVRIAPSADGALIAIYTFDRVFLGTAPAATPGDERRRAVRPSLERNSDVRK